VLNGFKWLKKGPNAGFCEHGAEPVGFTKAGAFLIS